MDDTPQSIYAKCLSNYRGYPLWFPEPSTSLPQTYVQDGLQIGDVGVVGQKGRFDVLLNITHGSRHALHKRHDHTILADFPLVSNTDIDADVRSADPPGCVIISSGITRVSSQSLPHSDAYEFAASCAKGAILILPQGAICHDLQYKERFRTIAVERALEWYEIARNFYGEEMSTCSLYLITGFYKAQSWCRAAFNDSTSIDLKSPRNIKLARQESNGNTTGRSWECTFPVDCNDGPRGDHNASFNQTVYISGFKIAVREDVLRWWAQGPVVVPVPAVRRLPCYARLLKKLFGKKRPVRFPPGTNGVGIVEHSPLLAPPFHPSDAINQFLLNKDPDALVAVTHDNQWMAMIEAGELALEDFMHEEPLERLLSENYSLAVEREHGAVYLQRNSNVTQVSDSKDGYQLGVRHGSAHDQESCWYSMPSSDKLQVAIIRIRAENVAVGLRRMPVGFCVLVEFDGTQKKTKNKQVRINDQFTEWDDVIQLPSELSTKVRLSVCASYEFSPMLGRGEALHTLEKTVKEWADNTRRLIMLREGEGTSCSSLLITTERRVLNYPEAATCDNDVDLDWEVSSDLAEQTDQGHDALLRYHNEPTQENLDIAIQHFSRAREICSSDHRCRAAVLRNLAMAKFLECQMGGTHASLDASISLYREALDLCHVGDLDRPGTLLYLAHTLVYRYDKEGCEESVAAEIKELVAQIQDTCSVGSHEHRAAELVLQTCARCRVINGNSPVCLDELISDFDSAAQARPFDYFDRSQWMRNLALLLLRRFELHGRLNDLERSIMVHEEAIRLVPTNHPNRRMMLVRIGVSYFRRYLTDLERSISTSEATLRWSPQSHADWSWIFANLSISSLSRLEKVGDLGSLGKSIVMMEEALRLMSASHPGRRGILMSLGCAYLWHFGQVGDPGDLEKSIATMEQVLQSMKYRHPDRPGVLMSLGHAYLRRFECVDVPADLDRAISAMEEALEVMPESHPNRPGMFSSLAAFVMKCFDRTDDPADLKMLIVVSEEVSRLAVDWRLNEEVVFSI